MRLTSTDSPARRRDRRTRRRRSGVRAVAAAVVALLGFAIVACGGNPSQSELGTLRVRLTDAPIDDLAEVNVFIEGLTVKHANHEPEQIASDIGPVDLLALQDTAMLLATAGVERGRYVFLRIELDESRSDVVDEDGNREPLRIASDEVKIQGRNLTVREGGRTTVTLDFDAAESLLHTSSGWILTPVVVIASVQDSS